MQKFLMRLLFVLVPAFLIAAALWAFALEGTAIVAFIFMVLLGLDVTRARAERGEF